MVSNKEAGKRERVPRPLMPREREFIHLIVYQGLTREEAYKDAFRAEVEGRSIESLGRSASSMFYRPPVNGYYQSLMAEIREKETEKAVWTKAIAEKKLMRLIERAEEDLYGVDKDGNAVGNKLQVTVGRLNAIVLPIKELNQMNGFNQTNVNLEGNLVQISGEDSIPD